ncbi:CLUMA_CG010502, isoform A [Clunio marinus]|uniref:CLUMA_CG010502, isoform A n=1 Tax=Clunio marinus TaxID=568069 RepID=A0A1J1IF35_9DIPT|nr:CLUMA_CG010502, isoform A [Clunio marinus]
MTWKESLRKSFCLFANSQQLLDFVNVEITKESRFGHKTEKRTTISFCDVLRRFFCLHFASLSEIPNRPTTEMNLLVRF